MAQTRRQNAHCLLVAVLSAVPLWDAASESLRAVKHGKYVFVRTPFSPEHDLVVRVGKGTNCQINFANTRLISKAAGMSEGELNGGELIHGNGDDATPWNINGTYIGGNHGCSDARELTCQGHGLTTADLGSEWADEAGTKFYLVKIADKDRLWFLSENSGKGTIWRFGRRYVGSALGRTRGGGRLSFTKVRMVQLCPACRIERQNYLADGKTPLAERKPTSCDYLDIVEEYDIINPASLLTDIIAHPGEERSFTADHLDAVIRNHIVYRFHPNGANVIHYKARALQEFRLGYMGFIQSAKLYRGKYDTHEYYIPKTLPFKQDDNTYNFRELQDYTSRPPSPFRFTAANKNIEDPQNLPERFIQFLGRKHDGKTVSSVGYALGYSLIHGLTRPEQRAKNASSAIMLYTSSKSYPIAINSKMGPIIPAGTSFHCIAYRQYFCPAMHQHATCFYWHEEAGDTIVYADYHKPVDRDVLKLPAELTGKSITVAEKTPSLTLHTSTTVPAEGLVVSVAGDYGYGVFRIR